MRQLPDVVQHIAVRLSQRQWTVGRLFNHKLYYLFTANCTVDTVTYFTRDGKQIEESDDDDDNNGH